jgi:hypothetical protein
VDTKLQEAKLTLASLSGKDAIIERLTSERDALQRTATRDSNDIQRLTNELQSTKQHVDELNKQIKEHQQWIEVGEGKFNKLKMKYDKCNALRAQSDDTRRTLTENKIALEGSIKLMEQEAQTNKQRMISLESQIKRLTDDHTTATKEVEMNHTIIQDLNRQLDHIQGGGNTTSMLLGLGNSTTSNRIQSGLGMLSTSLNGGTTGLVPSSFTDPFVPTIPSYQPSSSPTLPPGASLSPMSVYTTTSAAPSSTTISPPRLATSLSSTSPMPSSSPLSHPPILSTTSTYPALSSSYANGLLTSPSTSTIPSSLSSSTRGIPAYRFATTPLKGMSSLPISPPPTTAAQAAALAELAATSPARERSPLQPLSTMNGSGSNGENNHMNTTYYGNGHMLSPSSTTSTATPSTLLLNSSTRKHVTTVAAVSSKSSIFNTNTTAPTANNGYDARASQRVSTTNGGSTRTRATAKSVHFNNGQ